MCAKNFEIRFYLFRNFSYTRASQDMEGALKSNSFGNLKDQIIDDVKMAKQFHENK